MKILLTLGKNYQVAGISTHNTRVDPSSDGFIDITEITVPKDVTVNPQNWTFENGNFREFSKEEKQSLDFPNEAYLNKLRSERTLLLAASDWTQVPDAPVDRLAWAEYREELRNLPENTEDLRNINWPIQPQ